MLKKSFILHLDSLEVLDALGETDEEKLIGAGKLLFAFRDYHKGEKLKLDPVTKVAFSSFKNQFERDNAKYEKIVIRNQKNGSKGGRKKSEKNIEVIEPETVQPEKPKPKPKKTIQKPNYEEFLQYAEEKSNNVNKWKLKLKYDAWVENGWKDGHGKPIKSWKTKLLNTLPYLENDKSNQKGSKSNNQRTAGTYSRSEAVDKAQAVPRKNDRTAED